MHQPVDESIPPSIPPQAIEVRVPPLTTNWTYLSIVQPTKRGR